jgi:hypothetical protein
MLRPSQWFGSILRFLVHIPHRGGYLTHHNPLDNAIPKEVHYPRQRISIAINHHPRFHPTVRRDAPFLVAVRNRS